MLHHTTYRAQLPINPSHHEPDSEPHPSWSEIRGLVCTRHTITTITYIHLILRMCKSILPIYKSLQREESQERLNNLVSYLCLHASIYQTPNFTLTDLRCISPYFSTFSTHLHAWRASFYQLDPQSRSCICAV